MIVIVPFTELTEDQRTQIESAPDFLEFVESSSKIVQRALSDGYDYIRDYTLGADGNLSVRIYVSPCLPN